MLRSHWRAVATIIGCLVVAGLLWGLLRPLPFSTPTYQRPKAIDAAYYPGGGACKPKPANPLTRRQAPVNSDSCQEAAEQHRLQANDLIQQTRAADAAWASADLTYRQTIIALTGAILGLFTLAAAVVAALYAKRAAEAAEDSIKHGMDTSRSELRAYIMSESEAICRDVENPKKFMGRIVLKNTGATPAAQMIVTIERRFDFANGGVEEMESAEYRIGTLSPNASCNLEIDVTLDEDSERAFDQGKGQIALELRSPFRDNFGDQWVYHQDLSVRKECIPKQEMYTNDCGHTKQRPREEAAGRAAKPPMLPMRLPFQRTNH